MQNHHNQPLQPTKSSPVASFLNMLKEKALEILSPEEVEVTFLEDQGKITGYTYTKVSQKHVA